METIELWNIIKKGRKASAYRVHDIINVYFNRIMVLKYPNSIFRGCRHFETQIETVLFSIDLLLSWTDNFYKKIMKWLR